MREEATERPTLPQQPRVTALLVLSALLDVHSRFGCRFHMAGSRGARGSGCDVEAAVKRFSKPSTCFAGHDRQRIAKWCEVLKFHVRSEFKNFVAARHNEPLLLLYSADGTPASTKEVFKRSLGAQTVTRSGRSGVDLLVQRLFVRSGDGACKVLLDEPRPLASKTAWAHAQAYKQMLVNPRCFGHNAVLIHHCVWDRVVHSACERKVQMIHKAMELELGDTAGLPRAVLDNLSWISTGACVCHDAHNSLKWSVLEQTQDPRTLRGLFICIESLKNGFNLMMKNVRTWLHTVVEFEDLPHFPHRQLWQLLGIDPNIAEVAEELQLRFERDRLRIAKKWQGDAAVWDTIELVLLHIWAFKKYTDSRWLSVGPSCRCMLAAQVAGLSEFIAFILKDPRNSRYYIGGFADHWTADVAHLTAVIATASFPADAALAAVMEDDRVAMTVDSIEGDMLVEVNYIEGLPMDLWDLLGGRSMWGGILLRSAAISSSLTATGFMFWRLRIFHEWPWSLCRGDIESNLEELVESEEPSDQMTKKVWRLLRMGYSRPELVSAIRLLGNANFSSVQVEQGHSFASNILKRHKEVGADMVRCRSLVSSARPLIEVPGIEKKIMAASRQLQTLKQKRPQYFTGRQFYFQQLRCLASTWQRDGRAVDPQVSARLMKSHGSSWAAMPAHHRRDFETKASAARLELEGRIDEKKGELEAQLQVLAHRQDAEAKLVGNGPVRMSSARWGPEEMRKIQKLYDGPMFPFAKVAELRKQAQVGIGEPSLKMQRFLASFHSPSGAAVPPRPPWLGLVCRHRSLFSECIFKFQAGDGDFFFARPVFIRQNPFVVGFVRLMAGAELDGATTSAKDLEMLRRDWRHVFGIDHASFCFSDQGGFAEDWSVYVLTDSTCRGGAFFVADAEWKGIDEIKSWFPGDQEAPMVDPPCDGEREELAKDVPLWVKLPWLMEHFPPVVALQVKQCGSDSDPDMTSDTSDDEEVPLAPYMSAEEVIQAMYERRFHWAGQDSQDAKDFKVQLRGGSWTQQNRGMCYDSFRGFAMKGLPEQMCSYFHMTSTSTFSIRTYTEEGAQRLASMWCHKMQWCLEWWRTTGCSSQATFPPGLLDSYSEPDVGIELVGAAKASFARRLALIRAVKPR